MKTSLKESTDAGPVVSIHQHGVKMHIGQGFKIQDADYYIRYHLANGDRLYNQVNRCQSNIGDAVIWQQWNGNIRSFKMLINKKCLKMTELI